MSHAHRASYGSISDTYRSGIPSSGGIGAHYMGAGGSTYTGAGSGGSSGGPYHSAGSGHSERVRENYYSAYRYQTYFASPQRSDLFPLLCPTGLLSAVHGLLRKPHARFGRWRTRLPPAAILVRGSIAGLNRRRHLLRGRRGRRGQRSRSPVPAGAAHRHDMHQVGTPFMVCSLKGDCPILCSTACFIHDPVGRYVLLWLLIEATRVCLVRS